MDRELEKKKGKKKRAIHNLALLGILVLFNLSILGIKTLLDSILDLNSIYGQILFDSVSGIFFVTSICVSCNALMQVLSKRKALKDKEKNKLTNGNDVNVSKHMKAYTPLKLGLYFVISFAIIAAMQYAIYFINKLTKEYLVDIPVIGSATSGMIFAILSLIFCLNFIISTQVEKKIFGIDPESVEFNSENDLQILKSKKKNTFSQVESKKSEASTQSISTKYYILMIAALLTSSITIGYFILSTLTEKINNPALSSIMSSPYSPLIAALGIATSCLMSLFLRRAKAEFEYLDKRNGIELLGTELQVKNIESLSNSKGSYIEDSKN